MLTEDLKHWDTLDLSSLPINELVGMGVAVRDDFKDETRTYKQYEKDVKSMLLKIGMALKVKGDELGVNSFNTDDGTAYRNLKESYRVGDWNLILPWIKETGNWQVLEKRVGKLATKEIHKVTGELPPGVMYVAEEVFVIRRPNEKDSSDE